MAFYFLTMIILTIYSTASCLLSKSLGIDITFAITRYGSCMKPSANSGFISLSGKSVNECLLHCIVRPNCGGLNYRRKFKLCELVSVNSASESFGDCIFIRRSDISVEHNTCNEVCDGEQICNKDGKCILKVMSGCHYPEVANGKPAGNMFEVGDKQLIKCDNGYSIYGPSSILCLENGTWDSVPECRKECSISHFSNADVAIFTNSSGFYAIVTCHADYIINTTQSTAALITEETVACDNGLWSPNIDCIYTNNLLNIALGKPTSQSSTYSGAVASRGTDGIWDPDFARASCTHTAENMEPIAWWEVDLLQTYVIRRVKILNRLTDYFASRFRDVTVTIGASSNPTDICGTYVGPATSAEMVDLVCPTPITGQFVRLSKPNISKNLVVCEVGVYEN